MLSRLKAVLGEMSPEEAIEHWAGRDVTWAAGRVANFYHVGFLGPARAEPRVVEEILASAGFGLRTGTFPSIIVARELGVLRRRAHVRTTICMAFGEAPDGREVGVEIFLPEESEDVVRAWIDAGVSSHLALGMHDRFALAEARSALEAAGFEVPSFRRSDPLTAIPFPDGRHLLSMYLDRDGGSRIELCCHVTRITDAILPFAGGRPP